MTNTETGSWKFYKRQQQLRNLTLYERTEGRIVAQFTERLLLATRKLESKYLELKVGKQMNMEYMNITFNSVIDARSALDDYVSYDAYGDEASFASYKALRIITVVANEPACWGFTRAVRFDSSRFKNLSIADSTIVYKVRSNPANLASIGRKRNLRK